MELGEAEAFGVLDDHDGGVGDVDADFDHRGRDEDLRFVFAETFHDGVFFFAGKAAVEKAEFQFGEDFLGEALVFVDGGFEFEFRFFNHGINDVGLMAGGDFLAKKFPDAGEMRLGGEARLDGRAAGRKLIEDGDIEVAVERERERARNGRGGEDKNVRSMAVCGGFVHEALALKDAEAVLLVNGDEAEARELDLIFDEGVGADDELGFAGADAFESGLFFRGFEAADEQLDFVVAGSEDAPRGKIMLHGENFRGGHERGLGAVFDGDDGGLQRDDGFAAADVALEEAVHGRGLFKVGDNFLQDFELSGGRLEGEDALDGFADFFFADAEGDGVFLARGLAVEGEAELIEEKFLEDESLLRGRAKNVERFERFVRRGEVDVDEGLAASGIAESRAQLFGKNVGDAAFGEMLHRGVHGAANLPRAEGADGFVNGNDAANFGGVRLAVAEHLELGIDHFEARGAELIDFGFAVKDEELAGLEAAFEIAAVKKFAGEEAAGGVLDEEMVDSVVDELAADGLAAHDAGANGVDAVGLDVLDVGEMDAVFVAEGEVAEQVFESVDAALGEEFGALRADAFDHANFGGKGQSHELFFISFLRGTDRTRRKLTDSSILALCCCVLLR